MWVHLSGSLDTKVYISRDVYMESILVTTFIISIISCWVGAAMKFSVGTLTTHRVDRLVTAN